MKDGKMKYKRDTGSAMVEFVVVAPVFLLVLLGGLDIALASYRASALHFTVSTAMRWGILNQTTVPLSREQSIEAQLISIGQRYGLSLEASNISICSSNDGTTLVTTCGTDDAGDPRDYVAIQVNEPMRIIFNRIPITLSAVVVAKNEPG